MILKITFLIEHGLTCRSSQVSIRGCLYFSAPRRRIELLAFWTRHSVIGDACAATTSDQVMAGGPWFDPVTANRFQYKGQAG
jgi:hypothetical protein